MSHIGNDNNWRVSRWRSRLRFRLIALASITTLAGAVTAIIAASKAGWI